MGSLCCKETQKSKAKKIPKAVGIPAKSSSKPLMEPAGQAREAESNDSNNSKNQPASNPVSFPSAAREARLSRSRSHGLNTSKKGDQHQQQYPGPDTEEQSKGGKPLPSGGSENTQELKSAKFPSVSAVSDTDTLADADAVMPELGPAAGGSSHSRSH